MGAGARVRRRRRHEHRPVCRAAFRSGGGADERGGSRTLERHRGVRRRPLCRLPRARCGERIRGPHRCALSAHPLWRGGWQLCWHAGSVRSTAGRYCAEMIAPAAPNALVRRCVAARHVVCTRNLAVLYAGRRGAGLARRDVVVAALRRRVDRCVRRRSRAPAPRLPDLFRLGAGRRATGSAPSAAGDAGRQRCVDAGAGGVLRRSSVTGALRRTAVAPVRRRDRGFWILRPPVSGRAGRSRRRVSVSGRLGRAPSATIGERCFWTPTTARPRTGLRSSQQRCAIAPSKPKRWKKPRPTCSGIRTMRS